MRILNSRYLAMSTFVVSLTIAGQVSSAQVSDIPPPTAEEYEGVRQKLNEGGNSISPDDPSLLSEVLKHRYRSFVGKTFWVSPGVATFWLTSICGPTVAEDLPPPRPKKPEPTGSPNADREAMRAWGTAIAQAEMLYESGKQKRQLEARKKARFEILEIAKPEALTMTGFDDRKCFTLQLISGKNASIDARDFDRAYVRKPTINTFANCGCILSDDPAILKPKLEREEEAATQKVIQANLEAKRDRDAKLARLIANRGAEERAIKQRADAERAAEDAKLLAAGKVRPGMKADDIRQRFGAPTHMTTTLVDTHKYETWQYGTSKQMRFQDSVLTTYTESR